MSMVKSEVNFAPFETIVEKTIMEACTDVAYLPKAKGLLRSSRVES